MRPLTLEDHGWLVQASTAALLFLTAVLGLCTFSPCELFLEWGRRELEPF